MKLLSIKAHGFKSFADKIDITINDGITGIVGPNGSGKSNVVDAVKWVLGESSLKELRGGEVSSDIIFSGSTSRSPLTRAWVSLTFDNQDHYLATDFDTVEIKREVYKTGENEYYINNTKCRKKDITDLFIDSGANADSLSIISQGKIQEILKGRPQDKRVIIEEAAGVLKYKKRKEETLRKLDNTNDNLEKVNLVINELEVQVEPLKAQSIAASKYLELKNELEGIEVSLIASDIKNINDEYQSNTSKLETLNEEILTLDNETSLDNAKLESLRHENTLLDESISSLSEKLISINGEIANLEMRKQLVTERKKYEVEDQKLETNILMLKENIVSLKKNINSLNNDKNNLEKKFMLEKEVLSKKEEEYRVTSLKKNTLNQELSNKRALEFNLKNKITNYQEIIENDSKIPYAVKSVLNNPRLKGIHDVLVKLIDTEKKYVTSLEIALGTLANVIVCDDESSAKSAINYLKDNKLGRATFFPISVIKAKCIDDETLSLAKSMPGFIDVASNLVTFNPLYENIILNQLGNTLIVDNIDTMNKLGKKINYRYRIITLDGELLHTGGSLTGGINKTSNGLMNIKFDLEKCEKDLNVLINEIKLLEEHLNEVDDELKILESTILDENTKVTSLKEQIDIKDNSIEELTSNLNREETELKGTDNLRKNETDKELDEILNAYLVANDKKGKIESELSDKRITKNDLTSNINEIEASSRKQNSEYNKKQMEIKDLEVSLGKMDVKLDNLLLRLSDEYQITYEKAINEYNLDMDEQVARMKVNHLKRDIKDLGEVNIGAISEYERVNERYTFLTNQREDLNNAINNLIEIINDLDETMKIRFKETFDLVNKEFSEVFKKLFKGGKAYLSLTDEENLLETGIDISAEPPGKTLKTLTALSGGEMTLTAIALLFSVLNIRTVPFCILDEVEAALDEANVEQFGNYIKEYEHASQFIVITHKKKTMEYANTLYGITMQESGVSKLVSVKLENIE